MIRIALIFSALFSIQAFACPDLTGNYTCDYGNGESHIWDISYREAAGVGYYTINGTEFPADNSVIAYPDQEDFRELWVRLSCNIDLLKFEQNYKSYDHGRYTGHASSATSIGMFGPKMRMESSGTYTDANGGVFPLTGSAVCTKN